MKIKLLTIVAFAATLLGCQTQKPKDLFYETEWTYGAINGVVNHRFKIETVEDMQRYLDHVKNGDMGEFSGPWYIDENGEAMIAEELFKD